MEIIARIHTVFPTKFGVPRQSGLAETLISKIVFEPKYRSRDCIEGLEEFSHIWLLWQFSETPSKEFSPKVRPPRLGGNKRIGVFATRSPFRPNGIALSSVKLERIEYTDKNGVVLYVTGADMVDGTPIVDIKPYLPFTDCHTDASGGFAEEIYDNNLKVVFPKELSEIIPLELRRGLEEVLEQDPRPSYQNDPERVYGFFFSDYEIKFTVVDRVLYVHEIIKVK